MSDGGRMWKLEGDRIPLSPFTLCGPGEEPLSCLVGTMNGLVEAVVGPCEGVVCGVELGVNWWLEAGDTHSVPIEGCDGRGAAPPPNPILSPVESVVVD